MRLGLLGYFKKFNIEYLNVINVHDLTMDVVSPLRIGQMTSYDFLMQQSPAVKSVAGRHPVVMVKDDCLAYCGWLPLTQIRSNCANTTNSTR
jgi:hypothetical protein